MLTYYSVAAVIALIPQASLISGFQLNFPGFDSASGATSITWDPQTSNCSSLTIQHQCLPDKYVTLRTPVSDKYKMMPIPVDWLERLIKNGTSHCQAVAQCEDNRPNVSTLASVNVYLGSNSQGQPTFNSVDTGSSSNSTSTSSISTTGAASIPAPASSTNTVTPSTGPSQTAAAAPPPTEHAPLGPILGGTLGGLAALLVVASLLFYRRRKAARSESEKNQLVIIETPPAAPGPQALPTPFMLSSPSSPAAPSKSALPSPRSGGSPLGSPVDDHSGRVFTKARAVRTGLGWHDGSTSSEPLEGTSGSSAGAPSSSGRTDVTNSADEEDTRRQLMHLSTRVMQLEAGRGDGQLEAAPPRYSLGLGA